ncbi:MAG: hypothetical protein KGP14_16745 [Betaproteobacteria bacterium]|nr:hypothetical protein [Betaproteobacteria bacterium]
MPYEISWEFDGACKIFSGHLTEDEFVRSSEEIAGYYRFDRLRYIISDYTAVTSHGLTANGVEAVAAIRLGAWTSNPNIRSIVVAEDVSPGAIGVVARLQPLLRPHETILFSTIGQAREWISHQPHLCRPRPIR